MVGCSLPQSASGGCQLPQLPSIGRMLAATVAIGRMLYALVGCQLPQSPLVGCCMQGWLHTCFSCSAMLGMSLPSSLSTSRGSAFFCFECSSIILASHLLFMLSNAGHVSLKFFFDVEKPRNNGTLPLFKLVHGVTLMFRHLLLELIYLFVKRIHACGSNVRFGSAPLIQVN